MNVMECVVPAANAGTICAETVVYTRAAWDMTNAVGRTG